MEGSIRITPGRCSVAYRKAVAAATRGDVVRRIMNREAAVFTRKTELRTLIVNRLGWVDCASTMKSRLAAVERFGRDVLDDGIKHVVLMGMGGSSLCPDLFRLVFRKHPLLKSFDVIDSTDPAAVTAQARRIDPRRTLFIVASKSGGTVETRSHEAYFLSLVKATGAKNFGRHFCAITDPGSELEKSARRDRYRKIFLNPPDIGGRYSALSYFGLVPGFFAGVDLKTLIDDAVAMQMLLSGREGEVNPALALGSYLAATARAGHDKLTFVASARIAPLVPWIEQLVAESTGKQGLGIVPIEAEPMGRVEDYRKHRAVVFIRTRREQDPRQVRLCDALRSRGIPTAEVIAGSVKELGRQFLLWEAATALAGWHLGINPFDEPNVTESKNNTRSILAAFERSGKFPDQEVEGRFGCLSLVACGGCDKFRRPDMQDLARLLRRFFSGTRGRGYTALLNYFKSDTRTEKALAVARTIIRDRTGLATLRGYGPRYLHSVGQLYKGGPAVGRFVIFVRAHYGRLPIPGQVYDFGQLIAAQAVGDAQALMTRGLHTLVLAIDGGPVRGLEQFTRALRQALK